MNGDNEDNVNSSFSSLAGTTTVTILLSKRFVRTISIGEQSGGYSNIKSRQE